MRSKCAVVAAWVLGCGLVVAAAGPSGPAGASDGRGAASAAATSTTIPFKKVPRTKVTVPFVPTSAPITEFPGLGPAETYGATTYFWTPGEPVLAVGPSDILQTANEAAAVYSKTGTKLAEFDFGTFWPGGTVTHPVQCTDPRALYLASVDRFAMSCSSTSMRFAISETSDPAGAWYKYSAPNTSFLDQDKIEATSDKFIIAGNTSTTENIYVYNLADVGSGTIHGMVSKVAKKSNIYQAVVQQSPTSNGYFVASYPGQPLYLATITGTPAAKNVVLTEAKVAPADFAAPQEPAVPGGHIGGGLMDGRITDAVYEVESSDAKPVIQYSDIRECGTRTCVVSARIDLSGTTPVRSKDTLVGEPGYDYSYGAAGLDGAGDAFEVYARTSPTQTPSAAIVGPGFDVVIQPSTGGTTACATTTTPPCDERWGDYFGTAIDPTDPTSLWVTATYQATNGTYGWGSVIARVSTSSFSLPSVTTGAATKVKTTGATVGGTVNPEGVATTYHIDYGLTTGYDASTAETSAGSGSSPVAVSAVLTGLQENTLYHYRVVATTSVGSADGPDMTFKTLGPKITSVTFTGTSANPTVTISGTNFGTEPAGYAAGCTATGDNFGTSLYFDDLTHGWAAGQGGDCIGLVVSTYSATQIVYQFGSFYADEPAVAAGDAYKVAVLGKTFSGTVAYS